MNNFFVDSLKNSLNGIKILAGHSSKGAFYKDWKLVSLDGTVFDVPDTKENLIAFKRPKGGRGKSAFPQIRAVALVENGTHILFGAEMDSHKTSEKVLAVEVIKTLKPGMLCMTD